MPVKSDRGRLWIMELYPDDPSHMAALDIIRASYNYAAILHDKDTDDDGNLKKPHFHLILKFPQARHNTALSKELGVALNYMQKCGSFNGSARYLLHAGWDDKHQYDPSELEGPLVPSVLSILADESEDMRVLKILELINSFDCFISYPDFIRAVCERGMYADVRRGGYIITRLLDTHNAAYASKPREGNV